MLSKVSCLEFVKDKLLISFDLLLQKRRDEPLEDLRALLVVLQQALGEES